MKHIKIAAGLAHVNYGNIAGIVKEISDAGFDMLIMRELTGSVRSRTNPLNATFIRSPWTGCSSNRSTKPAQTC